MKEAIPSEFIQSLVFLLSESVDPWSIVTALGVTRTNWIMEWGFGERINLLDHLLAYSRTAAVMKNKIKVYRTMYDLTQEQLAKKLDVPVEHRQRKKTSGSLGIAVTYPIYGGQSKRILAKVPPCCLSSMDDILQPSERQRG
jgi:hypothetical protein